MQHSKVLEVRHMKGELHQVCSTEIGIWQMELLRQTALSIPLDKL
jgi:hypothetical protein